MHRRRVAALVVLLGAAVGVWMLTRTTTADVVLEPDLSGQVVGQVDEIPAAMDAVLECPGVVGPRPSDQGYRIVDRDGAPVFSWWAWKDQAFAQQCDDQRSARIAASVAVVAAAGLVAAAMVVSDDVDRRRRALLGDAPDGHTPDGDGPDGDGPDGDGPDGGQGNSSAAASSARR